LARSLGLLLGYMIDYQSAELCSFASLADVAKGGDGATSPP